MPNFYLPQRSLYTTAQQVKATLGTSVNPLGQIIASASDDLITYMCEQASQKIDEFCAPRIFYPYYKTSLYDWPGTSFELTFRDDILRLDSIINGDGTTIPPTTTQGGATLQTYFLYPPDVYPKYKVSLSIATGQTFLYNYTPQQALSLIGIFGYPANEFSGAWKVNSGATVQDNPQNSSSTTLTVPQGYFQAGQTVYIGTEMELIQSVAGGATNDICIVTRGHNGSTAASHVLNTQIDRVLVHPVIARAAARLVAYYFRSKDAADFGKLQLAAPAFGMIELPAEIPVDICGDLLPLCKEMI